MAHISFSLKVVMYTYIYILYNIIQEYIHTYVVIPKNEIIPRKFPHSVVRSSFPKHVLVVHQQQNPPPPRHRKARNGQGSGQELLVSWHLRVSVDDKRFIFSIFQ